MAGNKKESYDFIVSIGEDCACSSYLRRNKLQIFSYPLDWLTRASFDERIRLIVNGFEGFMEFEDLTFVKKTTDVSNDSNCDYYKNIKNNLYFYHDFPMNIPLEESFGKIKEKYNRRITRLYNEIHKAKRILLVWFSREKIIIEEKLKEAHEKLIQKFPNKETHFLIIENNADILEITKKKIGEYATKYTYNMFSTDNASALTIVMGNRELGDKVFSNYRLKLSFADWFRTKFKFFLIKLIPIKKIRKKLKNTITS